MTVEQDRAEWRDFLTHTDIFATDYCGYWLRGVIKKGKDWLVWEDDEQHGFDREPDRVEAIAAWKEGRPLPKGWFLLDNNAATKSFNFGVRKWGENWFEQADSDMYDYCVQMALLGEVRYG